MSISAERLATLVQREVALIINDTVRDGQVGYINVTEVRVNNDHSIATIYYTILSDEPVVIEKCAKLLSKNNSLIRMKLAEKIRNVRRIPELVFKYDEALAYGNHIEKILKELK